MWPIPDKVTELARPKRRHRRRLILSLSVGFLLMAFIVSYAWACQTELEMGFGTTPSTERSEQEGVSLEEARARFKYPIAVIPAMSWKEACATKETPVELLRVDAYWRQALLSYSHGIWLRFTRESIHIGFPSHGERVVRSGTVRGHAADITELGRKKKAFFCSSGFSCAGFYSDQYTGAKFHYLGAQVHWVENGVNVYLQGPFSGERLSQLAEQLRFDSA